MNRVKVIEVATRREIDYLRRLGTHSDLVHGDRKALLQSYRRSMSRRIKWFPIDRDEVHAALMEMLQEIEVENPTRPFIPLNGHGLFGARQYARFARKPKGAKAD